MRNWPVFAGLASLAAMVILAALAAGRGPVRVESPARPKVFSNTLAEGVVVNRQGYYGVDFIRCDACRMEKVNKGPLTFGGLNELVLEGLRIVIPPDVAAPLDTEEAGAAKPRDILNRLGVGDSFLRSQGWKPKFSSARVEGLEVLRLEGDVEVPLFTARHGSVAHNGLRLSGCSVVVGGATNRVGRAILRVKPTLALEWQGGRMEITGR